MCRRAVTRAQARDKVKRNVVALARSLGGHAGRPSKSLTLTQAKALLNAAEGTRMYAYIPLDAANVRRAFRAVVKRAGLSPANWTPRELRHSSVSVLSDSGVRIEDIVDLCGHSGTTVTEKVYRHQLRPVLLNGAVAMDRIFDAGDEKPAA